MTKLRLFLILPTALFAETGTDAWLRYTPHANVPQTFAIAGSSPVMDSIRAEWTRAIRAMSGQSPRQVAAPEDGSVVFDVGPTDNLRDDAYTLASITWGGKPVIRVMS